MTDTPLDTAAIRARCDAATQPPWEADADHCIIARTNPADYKYVVEGHAYEHPDADFIAHARTDIPALLDALAALIPLAWLGAWLLDERNAERYPDGFDVQDMAVKFGALHPVPVTERCGDCCRCEEYDNLPGDCYRETEAVTVGRLHLTR